MKKLSSEQMAQLFEAGYELRNIEYKPPFAWNGKEEKTIWIKEVIVRAILANTNTRYGGQIVIGIIVNDDRSITIQGLTDEELKSFDDFDSIKGFVDGFSFTNTEFDICWGEHQECKFAIITVREFPDIPAICRKDGQAKRLLIAYDIYTRSKKAPYSSIKATDAELREMINMAVDKQTTDLKSRGWIKKPNISPQEFYKKQIKDII